VEVATGSLDGAAVFSGAAAAWLSLPAGIGRGALERLTPGVAVAFGPTTDAGVAVASSLASGVAVGSGVRYSTVGVRYSTDGVAVGVVVCVLAGVGEAGSAVGVAATGVAVAVGSAAVAVGLGAIVVAAGTGGVCEEALSALSKSAAAARAAGSTSALLTNCFRLCIRLPNAVHNAHRLTTNLCIPPERQN
jgi:hypothetical protein